MSKLSQEVIDEVVTEYEARIVARNARDIPSTVDQLIAVSRFRASLESFSIQTIRESMAVLVYSDMHVNLQDEFTACQLALWLESER